MVEMALTPEAARGVVSTFSCHRWQRGASCNDQGKLRSRRRFFLGRTSRHHSGTLFLNEVKLLQHRSDTAIHKYPPGKRRP